VSCTHLSACSFVHAWYERGFPITHEGPRTDATIRQNIVYMMEHMKENLPRNEGNGWTIQKFHELHHVPSDVRRFGSPQNFDTSIGESSLWWWGKDPARVAQMRNPQEFLRQVVKNISVRHLIMKAKLAWSIGDDDPFERVTRIGGTRSDIEVAGSDTPIQQNADIPSNPGYMINVFYHEGWPSVEPNFISVSL